MTRHSTVTVWRVYVVPVVVVAAMTAGCRFKDDGPFAKDDGITIGANIRNLRWEANGRAVFDIELCIVNRERHPVQVDIQPILCEPERSLRISALYYLPHTMRMNVGYSMPSRAHSLEQKELARRPDAAIGICPAEKVRLFLKCDLGENYCVDEYQVSFVARLLWTRCSERTAQDKTVSIGPISVERPNHAKDRYYLGGVYVWESKLVDVSAKEWQAMNAKSQEQVLSVAGNLLKKHPSDLRIASEVDNYRAIDAYASAWAKMVHNQLRLRDSRPGTAAGSEVEKKTGKDDDGTKPKP